MARVPRQTGKGKSKKVKVKSQDKAFLIYNSRLQGVSYLLPFTFLLLPFHKGADSLAGVRSLLISARMESALSSLGFC